MEVSEERLKGIKVTKSVRLSLYELQLIENEGLAVGGLVRELLQKWVESLNEH
jgi:hypothetical protein